MLDDFFRLSAGDAERLIAPAVSASAERFLDVGRNRLCRLSELPRVNQPAGTIVEQTIHLVCNQHGCIKYVEIPVICHSPTVRPTKKTPLPFSHGT